MSKVIKQLVNLVLVSLQIEIAGRVTVLVLVLAVLRRSVEIELDYIVTKAKNILGLMQVGYFEVSNERKGKYKFMMLLRM